MSPTDDPAIATGQASNLLTPGKLDSVVKKLNTRKKSLRPTTPPPPPPVRTRGVSTPARPLIQTSVNGFSTPISNTPTPSSKRKAASEPAVSPNDVNEEKKAHVDSSTPLSDNKDNSIELKDITNVSMESVSSTTPSLANIQANYEQLIESPMSGTQMAAELKQLNNENPAAPLEPTAPPLEAGAYSSLPDVDWNNAAEEPTVIFIGEQNWPEEAKQEIMKLRKENFDLKLKLYNEQKLRSEELKNKITTKVANTLSQSVIEENPQVVNEQQSTSHQAPTNTARKVAVLGTSMTRGIDTACEIAGEAVDLHCYPGATLQVLAQKAKTIFSPSYQPSTIILHCGTINCLRFFGPQVVDAYKHLISTIRSLCPNAKIVVSKISYANYHGRNMIRDRPNRFTPGDRQRVDIVNLSMRIWAAKQQNVSTIDFLPPDEPAFFYKDGLHFSDIGRTIYHEKVAAYVCSSNFVIGK